MKNIETGFQSDRSFGIESAESSEPAAVQPQNLRFRFGTRSLLGAVAVFAGMIGAIVAGRLQGAIIFLSVVSAIVVLLAKMPVPFAGRWAVIMSGVGGAVLGWSLLHGWFGSQRIGHSWYTASLGEIGGWGAGLLLSGYVLAWLLASRQ